MLDACPHHHEEPKAALALAAETALEGLQLRAPGQSKVLTGKKYWRSLDELANTPSFQTMVHREFPHLGFRME